MSFMQRFERLWHPQSLKAIALTVSLAGLVWGLPGAIALPPSAVYAQTYWIEAWVDDLKQSNQRWIQVDLSRQSLTAWVGNTPVYSVTVSTGRSGELTPTGVFEIQSMHRYARMQGEDYDIPDVPYTMYYDGNYAIHGTYWHDRFGTPISNGCINVAQDHAAWLFNWASLGTPVVVQD